MHELMQYFGYDMFIYFVAPAVIVCNVIKIIFSHTVNWMHRIDILINVLLLAGLVLGLIFQGALVDITDSAYISWTYWCFAAFGVSLLAGIAHLALYWKHSSIS
ncbi:MAG: hypothetical protein Q4D42_03685 [Eubacteriales bacterium]|nr:hypothetical protein [Eubacteriales bacterium]